MWPYRACTFCRFQMCTIYKLTERKRREVREGERGEGGSEREGEGDGERERMQKRVKERVEMGRVLYIVCAVIVRVHVIHALLKCYTADSSSLWQSKGCDISTEELWQWCNRICWTIGDWFRWWMSCHRNSPFHSWNPITMFLVHSDKDPWPKENHLSWSNVSSFDSSCMCMDICSYYDTLSNSGDLPQPVCLTRGQLS